LEKLDRLLTAVHQHNKTKLIKERRMHDMIVAAMQENRAIIKAHIERMVTIFEAIIREGTEAGELKVEDPAEATVGQHRVHAVLPPDSDRALRSTLRRHRSGPARADSLYPESSRQIGLGGLERWLPAAYSAPIQALRHESGGCRSLPL